MDIQTYRQYVVNTGIDTGACANRNWTSVKKWAPSWERRNRDSCMQRNLLIPNHALVNSGEAYWTNSATLCLGYNMLGNGNIFRPIFSHRRQRMIDEFQPNIARVVKKRAEKMAYMAVAKIKKLPIVLVDEIISLAY